MEQQIFADGIGRIAIIDGIVRLDLVTHSATENGADGKPRLVLTSRVVMGTDQFLRAAEKIVEAARMIVEQRQPKTPAAASAPAQSNRPQTVDPQFKRESVRPEPPVQPVPPKQPFP
jgi:hypothetical protein